MILCGMVVQGEDDAFTVFGQWGGSCRLQGPMDSSGGGEACQSYLFFN